MTDTDHPVPCEACLSRDAEYDGDLCGPCYFAAIDHELSCDWLDDEEADR